MTKYPSKRSGNPWTEDLNGCQNSGSSEGQLAGLQLSRWFCPQLDGGNMKPDNRNFLMLGLVVLIAATTARAESLPYGAQRVSAGIYLREGRRQLPITIPDGSVFILTDIFVTGTGVTIYSADDLVNPKFVIWSPHSFQTGLRFSVPPFLDTPTGMFSFSGYFIPADYK